MQCGFREKSMQNNVGIAHKVIFGADLTGAFETESEGRGVVCLAGVTVLHPEWALLSMTVYLAVPTSTVSKHDRKYIIELGWCSRIYYPTHTRVGNSRKIGQSMSFTKTTYFFTDSAALSSNVHPPYLYPPPPQRDYT